MQGQRAGAPPISCGTVVAMDLPDSVPAAEPAQLSSADTTGANGRQVEVAPLLEEGEASAIAVTAEGVTWRGLHVSTAAIGAARACCCWSTR